MSISIEITLRWMPWDLIDDQSTLVQVMALCHQAIQAITWTNVDQVPWRHIASLVHSKLTHQQTCSTNPTMHQPFFHNAPFCNRNVHICAHFCYKMVDCRIFAWCIVGFVRWVYGIATNPLDEIVFKIYQFFFYRKCTWKYTFCASLFGPQCVYTTLLKPMVLWHWDYIDTVSWLLSDSQQCDN